jgi:hypothetical protein
VFGSGKRKYSLRLIMARLTTGAEASISMAFLVMCAEKILRLLRLFFILVSAWFYSLLRLCAPRAMSSYLLAPVVSELAVLA